MLKERKYIFDFIHEHLGYMIKDVSTNTDFYYLFIKREEVGTVCKLYNKWYIYTYKEMKNHEAGKSTLELSNKIKSLFNLYK